MAESVGRLLGTCAAGSGVWRVGLKTVVMSFPLASVMLMVEQLAAWSCGSCCSGLSRVESVPCPVRIELHLEWERPGMSSGQQ